MLNIENIRNSILNQSVYWTKHCLNRLNQRNILIVDVKNAINNGKIIEYYYEDYPFPSCLIAGHDRYGKIIHIVCGIENRTAYMITAYYPGSKKWEKDMKTRREKQ